MASTVEVIAEAMKAVGTPFITGHPGGESVELMDAARQRDMRFLLFKQEVAAAMMAATWGEITGVPGICLSTRGPGASNMVNGISYAALDRAPLIAITDQYDPATYATGLRQRLNQLAMYEPLVKWSTTVNAKTVRHQMRRAMREALAPPPGPVHFEMPQSETTREAGEYAVEAPLLANIVEIEPDRDSLREPLALIGQARRPIILAGLGTLWGKASAELTAFAEHLGAPVLVTPKCKGVISEDHPLRAGCIIGGIIERKLVSQADLIIAVGLDAVELQPKAWPYNAPVLGIAAIPNLDAVVPASCEVIGPVGKLLSRLAAFSSGGSGWGEKAARAYRDDVVNALNTPSTGLSPQRVMEVARAVLPRDTVATCDAGASRLLVVQKWESYGPREFLGSNGLGSMGYALPGAMAAKMAHPDRPAVAFVGDGGFMMSVAELQTSVAENLPVISVVFDDEEIGLIRVKQQLKQIPHFGVGIGGMQWDKLAQGFGADGVVVDNEPDLQSALTAALKSGKTTVIGAKIDGSGYVDQFNALREL
ncbi:MAG: thiamine pyrophosphate-binding protein [Alphaproteobacteria bacterium]|nr:thiamine pyrophosphate-binding protein [Alphaproteobacteria bacterium]